MSSSINILKTEIARKNYDEAIKFGLRAEKLTQKSNSNDYLLYAYNFLLEAYSKLNKSDKTKEYTLKQKQLESQIKDKKEIAKLMAEIAKKEKEIDSEEINALLEKKRKFLSEKVVFKNKFPKLPFKKQQVILNTKNQMSSIKNFICVRKL